MTEKEDFHLKFEMSKLEGNGKCTPCNKVPAKNEVCNCRVCNDHYHVACPNSEDKFATQSVAKDFNLASTKGNFMFMCSVCLTKFERILAAVNLDDLEKMVANNSNQRINFMENAVETMHNEISEMKQMMLNGYLPSAVTPQNSVSLESRIGEETACTTIAFKENLTVSKNDVQEAAQHKATWSDVVKDIKPPRKPVLVINKTSDEEENMRNLETVEEIVRENEIELSSTYHNKKGGLALVFEDEKSRDSFKSVVNAKDQNIQTMSHQEKKASITIVGLPRQYSNEEIISALATHSSMIKEFSKENNMTEHFNSLSVRPLKKNASVYQVFANVSSALRAILKHLNDKVVLGVASCKIYDRYYVLRCNKCQGFDHYAKDCESLPCCGKCSGTHETKDCDNEVVKQCINCVKSGEEDCGHYTFDYICPTITKRQADMKKKTAEQSLNSHTQTLVEIT